MSHPGNDHIIDITSAERDTIQIVNKALKEKKDAERLLEEAAAGIILLRDALDDAISVLDHNPLSKYGFSFLSGELKELSKRLKKNRKAAENFRKEEI